MEKEINSCLICGKEFDSLESAESHVEEEHAEILGEDGLAEHFVEMSYVSEEELSETSIEESPEETPDEDSVATDEEIDELTTLLEGIEDYQHLPKEDRDMVLEQVLPSKKKLKDDVKTSNLMEKLYEDAIQKLSDKESWVCPYCHKDLQAQAGLNNEQLAVDPRYAKVRHLKDAHAYLFEEMKRLFITPAKPERAEEPFTSNPESCSETEDLDLETLSKEELAQKISENPELRRQFFKGWKRKLEQKE